MKRIDLTQFDEPRKDMGLLDVLADIGTLLTALRDAYDECDRLAEQCDIWRKGCEKAIEDYQRIQGEWQFSRDRADKAEAECDRLEAHNAEWIERCKGYRAKDADEHQQAYADRDALAQALGEAVPLMEHLAPFLKYQRPGNEFYPNREQADGFLDRARAALARVTPPVDKRPNM